MKPTPPLAPLQTQKISSANFLENEKWNLLFEQGGYTEDNVLSIITKGLNMSGSSQKIQQGEMAGLNKPKTTSCDNEVKISSERTEEGKYSPKLYKTTCYFQPKQQPVSYSETVMVNIGSKKMRYFDSVYYENRLLPYRWTESVCVNGFPNEKNTIVVNRAEDCHYISLEGQQMRAMAEQNQQENLGYV